MPYLGKHKMRNPTEWCRNTILCSSCHVQSGGKETKASLQLANSVKTEISSPKFQRLLAFP